MLNKCIFPASVLILLLTVFSCQSENEEELYGKKNEPVDTLEGEIAYFPFDETLIDKKGNTASIFSKEPKYTDGISESVKSALTLDGTEYFMIDLGKTFDSISVTFFLKNDVDISTDYLPYLIDYGFGYSGARLDLDAISSATYLYVCSDSLSYPKKEEVVAADRINTRDGWTLFYFECTKGHTKTVFKYTHPGLGDMTDVNEQTIPNGNSASTQIITIGKGSKSFGDYNLLKGSIDELHIYKGFLTNKQIQNLYKELE